MKILKRIIAAVLISPFVVVVVIVGLLVKLFKWAWYTAIEPKDK